jgi:hypothetical protein
MRITRDMLLKIARDTVAQRTRQDRSLIAIFLHGSLLEDEFLLGGTADIDLFMLHLDEVSQPREIVPLSDEVHLDIAHYPAAAFRQTRALRVDPWLGPTLKGCRALHDPQHTLDFVQASVRGQFERPEFIFERTQRQIERARQIWQDFHRRPGEAGPGEVRLYLKALENAANAVAELSGPPLTERRFLLRYVGKGAAVGQAGLALGLAGLLGAGVAEVETVRAMLPTWEAAYRALPVGKAPARLHPARLLYYRRGIESLLEGEQPQAALWPLLRTWTLAVEAMAENQEARQGWQKALGELGLAGEGFKERIDGLDAYLDTVEETIERWARANGVYE